MPAPKVLEAPAKTSAATMVTIAVKVTYVLIIMAAVTFAVANVLSN